MKASNGYGYSTIEAGMEMLSSMEKGRPLKRIIFRRIGYCVGF